MAETLYRHKKRGTVYRILHGATFQYSGPSLSTASQLDDMTVIVYQDVDSHKVWVRLHDEFFDGRFEEVTGER